ncbi:MAG: hypothetical protein L3J69_16265 [Desulfobacula sp.]|nr:hypothetical protein [Desulfobacula sp.]
MTRTVQDNPVNVASCMRQGLNKGWKGLIRLLTIVLPLGLPVFRLWILRIVAAMPAAWLYSVFIAARRCYAQRAGHKKLCDH